MGIGVLADSEEVAAEYVTKLTSIIDQAAKDLADHPTFAGKIQIAPPKEQSEEPA